MCWWAGPGATEGNTIVGNGNTSSLIGDGILSAAGGHQILANDIGGLTGLGNVNDGIASRHDGVTIGNISGAAMIKNNGGNGVAVTPNGQNNTIRGNRDEQHALGIDLQIGANHSI